MTQTTPETSEIYTSPMSQMLTGVTFKHFAISIIITVFASKATNISQPMFYVKS